MTLEWLVTIFEAVGRFLYGILQGLIELAARILLPNAQFAAVTITAFLLVAAAYTVVRRRTKKTLGERYPRRQIVQSDLRRWSPTTTQTIHSTEDLDQLRIEQPNDSPGGHPAVPIDELVDELDEQDVAADKLEYQDESADETVETDDPDEPTEDDDDTNRWTGRPAVGIGTSIATLQGGFTDTDPGGIVDVIRSEAAARPLLAAAVAATFIVLVTIYIVVVIRIWRGEDIGGGLDVRSRLDSDGSRRTLSLPRPTLSRPTLPRPSVRLNPAVHLLRLWWWVRGLSTMVVAVAAFIVFISVGGALHEPASGIRAFVRASAIAGAAGLVAGVLVAASARGIRSATSRLRGRSTRARHQRERRGAPYVDVGHGRLPHPDGESPFWAARVNGTLLVHPDPEVLEDDIRRVTTTLLEDGEVAPTESEHFALRLREGIVDIERARKEMHTLVWNRFADRVRDGHEDASVSRAREDVLDDLREAYPWEYVELVRREMLGTGVIERVGEQYRYADW